MTTSRQVALITKAFFLFGHEENVSFYTEPQQYHLEASSVGCHLHLHPFAAESGAWVPKFSLHNS